MTTDGRPRVVILGGGFAGVGAAQKLKKAPPTWCSSITTTTTRSSRCCTSSPRACSRPPASATRFGDLVHDQGNATIHKTAVTALDLDARMVQFAEMEPLAYDYLVLALGAEVNFFGTEGAAEHGFPMYTLSDAVRLKEHVLARWEEADKKPALIDDGALNIVVVGGRPHGRRDRRRDGGALPR
jgi:NADH dehydrogenase